MTIEQARTTLITFNRWRRGEDVEPPLEPSDIGKAIDVAIHYLDTLPKTKTKQDEYTNNI